MAQKYKVLSAFTTGTTGSSALMDFIDTVSLVRNILAEVENPPEHNHEQLQSIMIVPVESSH